MASKRYKSSMTIEPMPKSFADKNLDPKYAPSPKSGERISSDTAKPGGTIKPEINATPKMRMSDPGRLISLQNGGTAQHTGDYKLHKGEKVMPADDPAGIGRDATYLQRDFYAAQSAHQTAVEAGGFRKHGANGNMIHSKSSAIAPHDKDK